MKIKGHNDVYSTNHYSNPGDAKDLSNNRFEHLISRDLDGKKQSKLSDRLQEILEEGQQKETE